MYPISNNRPSFIFSPQTPAAVPAASLPSTQLLGNGRESSAPILSPLSRQLSECAGRAAIRDNTLTREEMKDVAKRVLGQLRSDRFTQADTSKIFCRSSGDDPALIERDRQAALYSISAVHGQNNAPNPFAGLSREELVLIVYDETDTFTTNEKYAALRGVHQIELAARQAFGHRSQTGAFKDYPYLFHAEPLMHYRSLSLVEQAQYSDDYEDMLVADVVRTWAEKPSKDPERIRTLFEILAGKLSADDDRPQPPEVRESESAGLSDSEPSVKTNS